MQRLSGRKRRVVEKGCKTRELNTKKITLGMMYRELSLSPASVALYIAGLAYLIGREINPRKRKPFQGYDSVFAAVSDKYA